MKQESQPVGFLFNNLIEQNMELQAEIRKRSLKKMM